MEDEDDATSWDDDDDDNNNNNQPAAPAEFEEFDRQLIHILQHDFTDGAFIKLNFSAPMDAAWMVASSMGTNAPHVTSADEVYMLLKSSDFCKHDYDVWKLDNTIKPCLVLRRWCRFRPELEFRCFVIGASLVLACQRYVSTYSPFLNERSTNEKLWDMLHEFVHDIVVPHFPAESGKLLKGNFIVDVYVEESLEKIWVIDFGLTPSRTRNGDRMMTMMTWNEMDSTAPPPHPLVPSWKQVFMSRSCDRRVLVVQNHSQVDTSHERALSMHRVPLDLITCNLQDVMTTMQNE